MSVFWTTESRQSPPPAGKKRGADNPPRYNRPGATHPRPRRRFENERLATLIWTTGMVVGLWLLVALIVLVRYPE